MYARRWRRSAAPPGSIRAVPWTTRYSFRPGGCISVPSMESTTRGFRRTLRSFCCFSLRWPETSSSPSSPIHTQLTCGEPSALSVTRWPSAGDSISARASAGSSTEPSLAPDRRLGARDADRHQPASLVAADVGRDDGRVPGLAEDPVRRIRRVCGTAGRVRLHGIHPVERGVVEEQLARPGLSALDHLEVDVDGPPGVPAGEDRREGSGDARIAQLDTAEERSVVTLDAGVDALRIAVPDIDGGALDGFARVGVDDLDGEVIRQARP